MSEIRNLTRNGETFYPLACTEGLVNRDGSVVGVINDIFDISEYNASGTPPTLAKYSTLSLALAAVPQAKQKGGMTIRYVQSSDNKYVQYRYTGIATTGNPNPFLDVTNWQEENDVRLIGISDSNLEEVTLNFSNNTGHYIDKNGTKRNGSNMFSYSEDVQLTEGVYFFESIYGFMGEIAVVSKKVGSSYVPQIIDTNPTTVAIAYDTSCIFYVKDGTYVFSGYIGHNPKLYKVNQIKNLAGFVSRIYQNIVNQPIENSDKLITSGGAYNALRFFGIKESDLTSVAVTFANTGKYVMKTGVLSGRVAPFYGYTEPIHMNSGYYFFDNLGGYNNEIALVSVKLSTDSYKPIVSEESANDDISHNCSPLFYLEEGDYVFSGNISKTPTLYKINGNGVGLFGYINANLKKQFDELQLNTSNLKLNLVTYDNVVSEDPNHLWDKGTKTKVDSSGNDYGTLYFNCKGVEHFDLRTVSVGVNGGGFVASLSDNKAISTFSTGSGQNSYLRVPAGAKYISITYEMPSKNAIYFYSYTQLHSFENSIPSINNQWRGKKICIIGTSVAFGSGAHNAYGKTAADNLGAEVVPACVPGLAIHGRMMDGVFSPMSYGSSSLSIADYATARAAGKTDITIDGTPVPTSGATWIPGGSVNSYYKTFENVFSAANADVDLWVFAVAPNNNNFALTDWNAFDKDNWKYNDAPSEEDPNYDASDPGYFRGHRTTFLGALLFLMDKMYQLNPKARMVFLLDSEFRYTEGKTAFGLLKEEWNIPIIDLWGKINTTPKSIIQIEKVDNHPSDYGQEIMGDVFTNELLLIR